MPAFLLPRVLQRRLLFFCAPPVAVFAYDAGEHIVRQFDPLRAVAFLEPQQPRADQLVKFVVGQMRRHRVLAGVAVAEPLLGDQLGLDESATRGGRSRTHDE